MSRMKKSLLFGLILIVVAIPATGFAQLTNSGVGLGARYSYATNIDTEENSSMLGVMLRMHGQYVGIEGAVDYRNEDLGANIEQKTWPVTASLMLYPIPQLYGLAGLGWYNSTIDFPDGSLFEDNTDTQLGYHVGAGVEVPVAQTFSLTGDVRWQFVDYEFDEIPSSIGADNADTYTLNAGVLFYLR